MRFIRHPRSVRTLILKADTTDELGRLERLLSAMESRVRDAFAEFLREMRSATVLKEVADRLEAGDIDGALAIADSHVQRFAAVLPRIFQDAGVAEAAEATAKIKPLRPAVGVSFNAGDPAAAAIMQANSLDFIRDFSGAQRETTRTALVNALGAGDSRQAAALAFRDSIGLTPFQANAVENYRSLLEQGSRQALDRVLRDRRFDPSVERAAADGGAPLSESQIDRMVDRYRARYLAYRSETIARTESVRTISQAREEAFRQAITTAGIDESQCTQTWVATEDNRTRVTHRALDGQEQVLGQPFVSISGATLRYPGDPEAPIEETVNCRCHRTFKINL